jgi:hypothetical protein
MIQLFAALISTLFAATVVHSHALNSTPDASQLLLQSNARWAENMNKSNSTFFTHSGRGHRPKVCPNCCETLSLFFWSRPSSDPLDWVLGLPCSGVCHYWLASWGNLHTAKYCKVRQLLFTTRYMALTTRWLFTSQVPSEDVNALSVLEYAVDHLLVEHGKVHSKHLAKGLTQQAQSSSSAIRGVVELTLPSKLPNQTLIHHTPFIIFPPLIRWTSGWNPSRNLPTPSNPSGLQCPQVKPYNT